MRSWYAFSVAALFFLGVPIDARATTIDFDDPTLEHLDDITNFYAALGVTFYTATQFPSRYQNGAFVGLHGSWNRSKPQGYKVAFVPFTNGKPGPIEDFLTGWTVSESPNQVWGRPVGVFVAPDGSLLGADDGGSKIWRVRYTGGR